MGGEKAIHGGGLWWWSRFDGGRGLRVMKLTVKGFGG